MMFDPYSGAPIDQWGNPVPPQYHNGYYQQPPQPSPYSGYTNPTYGGPQGGPADLQNPGGPPPGQGAGYNQYGGANPYPGTTSTPRTPFRLHDGGINSPSPAGPPGGHPGGVNPVKAPYSDPAAPSRASSSTLPRRLSESQQMSDMPLAGSAPMSPTGPGSRPSYSRQTSRDSAVGGSASPNLPPRRYGSAFLRRSQKFAQSALCQNHKAD